MIFNAYLVLCVYYVKLRTGTKFAHLMDFHMCYYSDLFGDVIVTIDDINTWLDCIPEMKDANNQRRNYYANNNDVANKIKLLKLNDSFEKVIKDSKNDDNNNKTTLDICKTIYKTDSIELQSIKCPDYFHVCNNPYCPILKKRLAHEKAALRYAKLKSKRG